MKLKKVYIEITNNCNLSCDFCVKSKRRKGFISLQNFAEVVEKVKPVTEYIYLHVLGEPLLHPEIGAILDIAGDYGMKTSITTNGSLIARNGGKILRKKALRQINYSLHSFGNNMALLHDVFSFIADAPEVYHCLRLWNMEEYIENGNGIMIEEICRQFGVNAPDCGITRGNGVRISENVFLQIDRRFTWPGINLDEITTGGKCLALKNNVGILLDGTVVPCCLDSEGAIPLGNIYRDDLQKLLTSARAVKMVDGFRRNIPVERLCRTCGFLKRLNSPNC